MVIAHVRKFILIGGFAICLALGTSGTGNAAPVAGNTTPAWNGLAPTPPMGYNNWSYYQCNINEALILAQAKALVSSGLAKKGYDTITIDDCWMAKKRNSDGTLAGDPQKFPHGMAWMGQQVHALGLKFGIYEDAGDKTCAGFPGSWNFFQKDADTFAKWNVDYIKLDGCNVPAVPGKTNEEAYHYAYKAFSDAILHTHRKMVYSESAPAYFQNTPDDWYLVLGWVAKYGNLWREGDDIALGQYSGASKWKSLNYNYSYNVGLWKYAGPGHWNDPDFLLVGDSGLSGDEMQSQMSLWAIMAAPLISSTNIAKISPAALSILSNADVIAVDQDPAGVQGHIVQFGETYDVLAKPLSNGDVAVVLYNKGSAPKKIATTATLAGFKSPSSLKLKNLVSKSITTSKGTIEAIVPPHGSVIYRVTAQ
ncbi:MULTISPECIES: glycoside hydrolase family 27 protein [Acidobacteriaceae]|uniref:glycoside hydrolase family 27 protein n=1 Tax=Acidobacteriaceae TaxID=204434 RepID=UPI00131AEFA7|nr:MULTISPECIES: glycoside hydrolase family 27 protein [Acidobacteriaceae]MDW5266939.1 glycoside hydrolase family 27 protein [Edaphobacter sp.]